MFNIIVADALKLLLKEYVAPTQANMILFFLGPVITLVFALLGYAVIPYGPGLTINDMNLGIFYLLAVSSIATYGILLAGWSANSKYAFLGSLRSTAQLISYELVLSSAILIAVMLTGSLNLTVVAESQRAVWLIFPLLPIFIIFFIGSIAETNRAPFDLAEAESELVSGFMTEHAAVVFVFFFLAEYGSIVLMCILTSLLFLGGYLPIYSIFYLAAGLIDYIYSVLLFVSWHSSLVIHYGSFTLADAVAIYLIDHPVEFFTQTIATGGAHNFIEYVLTNPNFEGVLYGLTIGLKSSIMIFVFIWARAFLFFFIRLSYLLMSSHWTYLLFKFTAEREAFILFFVSLILYSFEAQALNFVSEFSLMTAPFLVLQVNKNDLNLDTTLPIKEEGTLVSIPVKKHYSDILEKSSLYRIKKDLKSVSGIYAFMHNDSKKLYIGSSFSLAKRINSHLNNWSSNILLQRAFSKHGLNKFSLYILDTLNISTEPNLSTAEASFHTLRDFMLELTQLEQKYLDLFLNKYNINPASSSRLGAKHSEETKALFSKINKENPRFLNKTFSNEVLEEMRKRMSGPLNPMYGKPVSDANKKLISDLFRKEVYLYDANTFTLISKFNSHKDLVQELKISSKTVIKYKDSGMVYKDKYIISSKSPEEIIGKE